MPGAPTAHSFELVLTASGDRFNIVALRGREELSQDYAFSVTALTSRVVPFGPRSLLGRRATLLIREQDRPARVVHGVITRQQMSGNERANDRRFLRLRLSPRFALLRHRRRSRIFQDLTVIDVVREVLGRADVAHEVRLDRQYPRLEYCVQYAETDHAFVQRLLAENGLFYYYRQAADPFVEAFTLEGEIGTTADLLGAEVEAAFGDDDQDAAPSASEVMVIADQAFHYPALAYEPGAAGEAALEAAEASPPLELQFHRGAEAGGDTASDVREFALRERTAPTAAVLTAFDFLTPHARLTASTKVDADTPDEPTVSAWLKAERLEVHDHHDEYGRGSASKRDARVVLDRERARAVWGRGEAVRAVLTPGHRFALVGHPVAALDRDYVLARVEHFGEVTAHAPGAPAGADPGAVRAPLYRNRFECAPADVALRPPSPGRAHQQVLETAVVVGPPGEEVYTDALARVKVRFHWDLGGASDERASCWMRAVQPWAGPGFGGQWIPRVGMEVVVGFLEGDTDRPVILGAMYNGANAPPFDVPADKTRSGVRTRSSPAAEGYNELSFEDRVGHEQVLLRAERDLDIKVLNDHHRDVGAHEKVHIAARHEVTVDGARADTVAGDESRSVGGAQSLAVGGDRAVNVTGAHAVSVAKNTLTRVGGSAAATVGGNIAVTTGGSLQTTAGVAVVTDAPTALANVDDFVISAAQALVVGRAGVMLSAGGTVEVTAGSGITLTCGSSTLHIGSDAIQIASPTIVLAADGATLTLGDSKATLSCDGQVTLKGDKALLKSSGASVGLAGDAKIDGSSVKLKSSSSSSDDASDSSPDPTEIELVDADGNALAHEPYVVIRGDGSKRLGVLGGDGKAKVVLDDDAEVDFPRVHTFARD